LDRHAPCHSNPCIALCIDEIRNSSGSWNPFALMTFVLELAVWRVRLKNLAKPTLPHGQRITTVGDLAQVNVREWPEPILASRSRLKWSCAAQVWWCWTTVIASCLRFQTCTSALILHAVELQTLPEQPYLSVSVPFQFLWGCMVLYCCFLLTFDRPGSATANITIHVAHT